MEQQASDAHNIAKARAAAVVGVQGTNLGICYQSKENSIIYSIIFFISFSSLSIWNWCWWFKKIVYFASIICQRMGSRLSKKNYQRDTLLDRNTSPSCSTTFRWSITPNSISRFSFNWMNGKHEATYEKKTFFILNIDWKYFTDFILKKFINFFSLFTL